MIATRDFRYFDHLQRRSIDVHAGEDVPAEQMGRQKVDVEKLVRTKYLIPKDGEAFGEKLVVKGKRKKR